MAREQNPDRARLTFLDHAVIWWNPQAGEKRVMSREKLRMFGYDAANPGTKRGRSGGRSKNGSSENWRTSRDRVSLMWDARDVVRNFGILRGIVARIVQYVADRVQYVSQTGDEEIDTLYQDYFHNWCETADITGRHRLGDLVWLAMWAILVDGDHGWNLLEIEDRGERALKVQAVEGDRIGDPNQTSTNDPNYISGIVVDDIGRPTSYKIYKRDRQGTRYDFEQEVSAGQFIHIFDPWRVDQYRGVTALATAIAPARDLYEIYTFEKLAAKWQSGHAGFVQDDLLGGGGQSAWNNSASTGKDGLYQMQPGLIQRLQKGQQVVFAPGTNRPSGAFMTLVEVMVREIASGTNFPYGFLYDMSAFSGHTGRIEIAQAMRGVRRYQRLLSEQALDPVRDAVLGRAIGLGELPPHPKWRNGRWGFGPTLTGDYGHDTAANIQMLNAGIITATDLIAETGQTFEEITRRSASEVAFMQRVASETGIPIEMMNGRLPNATQALAAMNTPPQPPGGLVEQGTDVKPLLELLKQAGEGIIDRESAIASIVTMYDVSRADAEAMVPQPQLNSRRKFGMVTRKIQKTEVR